jgi:predicted nuclease of predicted toxin-antitoxin system
LRFKLDENLGRRAIDLFLEAGHDISTVAEQELQGAADDQLINICRDEARVLVTLDLDFSNVLRYPPETYAGIAVLRAFTSVSGSCSKASMARSLQESYGL